MPALLRVFLSGLSGTGLAKVTTDGYHAGMKAVGIKVLKAKLSEYLRLVKTGVTVLVTERDEVIAEIHPARRQKVGELTLQEKLAAMAERGEATLASRPLRRDWSSFLKSVAPVMGIEVRELLDALRDDTKYPGEPSVP
jgi:antitoxin (DNA-binding transcriptional repressor) of toxin-antitoxin stability system